MTSANVALVRSIFAEWEHGDFSSSAWAHPDLELVIADGPDPGRWIGLSECAEAWRELLSAWEGLRSKGEEYLELDDERVLVLARFSGHGKRSGLDLGQMGDKGAGLFHVREGKVRRHVVYLDRERAFADLGFGTDVATPPSRAD
jgi:ketosteroid isomerase-like protein